MKLPRRNFLHLATGAAALPAVSRFAWAQTYPTRPLRLIIGYPPGGSADTTARLMAQWLSEELGQSVIVESRPGGGTNIATEAVVRAPPDGYTLLLVAPANAINASLYDRLNYNFIRDIAPVAGLIRFANVVVVNPSVPAKTIPELIAYAKANPGKLNMASSGNGSTIHVSGELFKMMAGVNMVHVPYRGGAPAMTDLLAGQVHVISITCRPRCSTSAPASCAHWRSPARRARSCCRICPRSAISYRAMRPLPGTASALRPAHPPTLSTSSTRRRMRSSPIPRWRSGSPISAPRCSRARRPISASF